MHQLLLMRHAKAERARDDLADHDRALAESGVTAAERMQHKLRQLGVEPDVVLVSSAKRARETLERVLNTDMTPNIEVLETLYMAPAARITELLRGQRETARSILVVGHNPGIGELAAELAAAGPDSDARRQITESFPTARLAEFLVLTPWRHFNRHAVRLQRLVDPKG